MTPMEYPMRRFALLLATTIVLASVQAAEPAADSVPAHRTLLENALASLPDVSAMPSDAPWKAISDQVVRQRMDGIHEAVTTAMLQADAADSPLRDFEPLKDALRTPKAGIDPALLAGDWHCRKILVNGDGVIAYPYFDCVIRQASRCLELVKTTGSQRIAGCLHVIDEQHLAFVGRWQTDYDSSSTAGFVSAANRVRLRMIEPDSGGITVSDFWRSGKADEPAGASSAADSR